ncbi:cytochrome B5 [Geothermobacter hydrogeniphilus]|uniref:Cytochrome B5 n=2 Tax=Geothermobacter hydrogeniphilus TaxID=1969733 RepID=A0A2K2H8X9_9BACT|nr:cytochrome B5 [Geothermobacter hydrogeniphilus]
MRESMTRDELRQCDGRDGRRACFAVNGKVYDVSDSPLWANGDHRGAHQAGSDLTEELRSAPHVRSVIERFPVIGELETTNAPRGSSGRWIVLAGGILAAGVVILLLLK